LDILYHFSFKNKFYTIICFQLWKRYTAFWCINLLSRTTCTAPFKKCTMTKFSMFK
jgi:hypothetical protein